MQRRNEWVGPTLLLTAALMVMVAAFSQKWFLVKTDYDTEYRGLAGTRTIVTVVAVGYAVCSFLFILYRLRRLALVVIAAAILGMFVTTLVVLDRDALSIGAAFPIALVAFPLTLVGVAFTAPFDEVSQ